LEFTSEEDIRKAGKISPLLPIDRSNLQYFLGESRAIKQPGEINEIKLAASEASLSFIDVFSEVNEDMTEARIEGLWFYKTSQHAQLNSRFASFLPCVSYGTSSAILHHAAENDVKGKDGDLFLLDAGTSHNFYASDITRTIPINGKFDDRQRKIYSIVLRTQKECIDLVKPGIQYEIIHRHALSIITSELLKLGFVKKKYIDFLNIGVIPDHDEPGGGEGEGGQKGSDKIKLKDRVLILRNRLAGLFMPHGVGHMLGLDTHDVAGYERRTPRLTEPSFNRLRLRRQLEAGMVVTIEPGIYFNKEITEPVLELKEKKEKKGLIDPEPSIDTEIEDILDASVVRSFYDFGGIRIEDDVLVTADGHEVLTFVPKEIADLEKLLATRRK
ncbi:MAG: putative Xaa-Pro dipeptidase, partial [Streblomastix strix]